MCIVNAKIFSSDCVLTPKRTQDCPLVSRKKLILGMKASTTQLSITVLIGACILVIAFSLPQRSQTNRTLSSSERLEAPKDTTRSNTAQSLKNLASNSAVPTGTSRSHSKRTLDVDENPSDLLAKSVKDYEILANEIYGEFLRIRKIDRKTQDQIFYDLKAEFCRALEEPKFASQAKPNILEFSMRVMNTHLNNDDLNYFVSLQYNFIKKYPILISFMNRQLNSLSSYSGEFSNQKKCMMMLASNQ